MTRGYPGASNFWAGQSAFALGLSHNIAFDKKVGNHEAYNVSYRVLSQMYSYGARGSWAKMGSDITWSNHLRNESVMVPESDGSRYNEAKNRFHYMHMKMEMEGSYNERKLGNNYERGPNDVQWKQGKKNSMHYGHWLLGRILGPELMYYGFEVWGEPYTPWDLDDYYDDGNTGYPMDGTYDTRW